MSNRKKDNVRESTPDTGSILEEYRKEKGKRSHTGGLSQKIMEITRAGGSSAAEAGDICILCDAPKDVCDPCDYNDWACNIPYDIICIFTDGCDTQDINAHQHLQSA